MTYAQLAQTCDSLDPSTSILQYSLVEMADRQPGASADGSFRSSEGLGTLRQTAAAALAADSKSLDKYPAEDRFVTGSSRTVAAGVTFPSC